ncbi:LysE family transporter [Prescottella equi]|uniref:LysE family transporter n=1 Tax=Rhodococcus hoagii TaxID=43767 RepID=A0AAE5CG18_RHOHA|nr:LysE family transporter [Prescottella equi]GBF13550.1 homoserine/homoserine lactone efflux protein [Rhodococcus sp. Br-6]MBM4485011.1 LysE family transporter [Prescottella equi]MBM4518900.1 LysE family transporter [Prescottella equi]MBM4530680.1 LysE family transporter [Prescottella equi]MBM4544484.1 LysE family transporter [Prescottella equi]
MSWQVWVAFFGASWVISLSPGAGAIASMTTGLNHGFLRGYWNILGLQLALLLQIAIVAAGVGALLAGSTTGFMLVKWFGVAYLAYLGVRQWRSKPDPVTAESAPDRASAAGLVLRAFLVNSSNPKAIVFMLAVLPQFLDPAAPLWPQYALIAATMVVVDTIVMTGYTGLAARVLRLLRSPRQMQLTSRVFATLFFAAAAALATAV